MTMESQTLEGAFLLAEIGRQIFGIAAAPRVICMLKAQQRPASIVILDNAFGVAYLVDGRIQDGKCEVFYTAEAWAARCEEQRRHDAR